MREEMFLKPEYYRVLKFLEEAGSVERCSWKKIDSTAASFKIQFRRYEDFEPYELSVYLKPYRGGVYMFYRLSEKYSNEKIVPQSVLEVIERASMEARVSVIRLDEEIDRIDMDKVSKQGGQNYYFVYWAFKFVDLRKCPVSDFNSAAESFIFYAERIEEAISRLYR